MTNIVTNTQNIFSPAPSSSHLLLLLDSEPTPQQQLLLQGLLPGAEAVDVVEMVRKLVLRATVNGEDVLRTNCPQKHCSLSERQRDESVNSRLIFVLGDPVGGCYRLILNLYRQINLYQEELQFVYREISVVAMQQQNINMTACSVHDLTG
ncbi:hypothetical protein HAX54_000612 [Datura stramonium]|uniref:Uncharacterized protein n=1 Tax=Datura stramonium TaxID=4076 RepID=A0ABS8WTZ2_DATST|nr:hypothetical protein [Datura stramonium]